MNIVNYLQFLEPVQQNVSRVYSTTSGIITVLLGLWCLNILVGLIQKIFATGKAVGSFYHKFLQRHFERAFKTISNFQRKKTYNQVKDSTDISLI